MWSLIAFLVLGGGLLFYGFRKTRKKKKPTCTNITSVNYTYKKD